jgi:hypothetical protein
MKSCFLVRLAVALGTVLLVGCGGDQEVTRPIFVSHIQSDPNADGDIAITPPSTFTISSALTTGSVLAGIDPISGDEFNGFLGFPLGGPAGVPVDALIVSATLEIFIAGVTVAGPADTVPLLIDLVSFQPPTLVAGDITPLVQPPLISTTFDVFTSDTGTTVPVDVTPLMTEAQRHGLRDFQLRLLLDLFALSGLVEIDDSIAGAAPLLTVEFF